MAGNVVSAASAHIGEAGSLVSEEDVRRLREARYLDAPAGAPPPKKLIAMRLDDHGGGQRVSSRSPDNVLDPALFPEEARRHRGHGPSLTPPLSYLCKHRRAA